MLLKDKGDIILIFGSFNCQKILKLSKKISLITPKIKIRPINLYCKQCSLENGRNEKENAIIKAKFYKKFINKYPVISEDDGIYFHGLSENEQPSFRVKKFIQDHYNSVENIINWLNQKNIKTGFIKKCYVLINHDILNTTTIKIPFTLKLNGKNNFQNNANIFNEFIIPQGFERPISEFSESEEVFFDQLFFHEKIKRLLSSLLL